ncbi:MAG TPA: SRPBCC domain-containing protein [Chryseolinea sp.]|nr:SRPBCC domain-containing protein [Chryseolinea sp.]
MGQTTENSLKIAASQEAIYAAFTIPSALEAWQAPGEMTAKVHHFDLSVGGGYTMSLTYPDSETGVKGKTTIKEDRYTAKFLELKPYSRIVEAIRFDTTDPDFAGEMIMNITLEPTGIATRVTIVFENIPRGIRPSDNEAGTASSLNKLAEYVKQ